MKNYFVLFLIMVIIPLQGCKKDNPEPSNTEPITINLPSKASEVIEKSNAFGLDLFKEVSLSEDENFMISPLSASTALTMLLNGCNTETYNQIRDMLGFEGLTTGEINAIYRSLAEQLPAADPKVTLALANAVWYRLGFNVHQSYLDTMDLAFDSHIEGLDFDSPAALDVMNQWASDNTHGRIPKVLDEISDQAAMFLMNALYFKGDWTYQFDPEKTATMDFYSDDGSSSFPTPFMKGIIPVKLIHNESYDAAEFTYGQKNFSMLVLVPKNSLQELIPLLDAEEWHQLTTTFDNISEPGDIDVLLPKFKFEFDKKLNDELEALGMVNAFIPGLADLSGIADQSLFVSFVKQNSFIEVNEEGTEAAAVTTIGIEYTSLPDSFFANRPFIFAIRERTTNVILFMGQVVVP